MREYQIVGDVLSLTVYVRVRVEQPLLCCCFTDSRKAMVCALRYDSAFNSLYKVHDVRSASQERHMTLS